MGAMRSPGRYRAHGALLQSHQVGVLGLGAGEAQPLVERVRLGAHDIRAQEHFVQSARARPLLRRCDQRATDALAARTGIDHQADDLDPFAVLQREPLFQPD
jgi:hypothetical protein